jgi:hypothetical protein
MPTKKPAPKKTAAKKTVSKPAKKAPRKFKGKDVKMSLASEPNVDFSPPLQVDVEFTPEVNELMTQYIAEVKVRIPGLKKVPTEALTALIIEVVNTAQQAEREIMAVDIATNIVQTVKLGKNLDQAALEQVAAAPQECINVIMAGLIDHCLAIVEHCSRVTTDLAAPALLGSQLEPDYEALFTSKERGIA